MDDIYNQISKEAEIERKELLAHFKNVLSKINYPSERIKNYLRDMNNWHIGYVRVREDIGYVDCSYPSYRHYSVFEEDNKFKIPSHLMRQDDNKEDNFHSLVWQTCGYCGDDYSGFIGFPLTDGTYWIVQYTC